jgi:hypothetical protein
MIGLHQLIHEMSWMEVFRHIGIYTYQIVQQISFWLFYFTSAFDENLTEVNYSYFLLNFGLYLLHDLHQIGKMF